MTERIKRLCAVLICVALLGQWLPGTAVAESYTPVEAQSWSRVNPLYADVITEEDLTQPGVAAVADTDEYCETLAEAAAVLRAGLVERSATIVVKIKWSGSYTTLINDIWDEALLHTGEPAEGDYLLWQFQTVEANMSGYGDSTGRYYFTLTYTVTYYTDAAQEAAVVEAVEALVEELGLLEIPTAYGRIQAVYDWMTESITYDYTNLNDSTYTLKYTAYAALINKTAVCQGYSLLLYRLLLTAGVDCRIVTGTANGTGSWGGHGWNIVRIGDVYYNVDATWDATCCQAGLDYEYFLKCDSSFTTDHRRGTDYSADSFYAAYPMATADFDPDTSEDETLIEDPVVASGTCGKNLTWVLTNDGTLTISGTGEMTNYPSDSYVPWYSYRSDITTVVIEDGVTSIGSYAFLGCTALTQITIPNSVTAIGKRAFDSCTSLTGLDIPNSVTSIGSELFNACTSLTAVTIPNSVTSIGASTFMNCTALTDVTLPEGLTKIVWGMFFNCTSLQNVTIPDGVTMISANAFGYCASLARIDLPDGLTTISNNAFIGCATLTEITVPASVTYIAMNTFAECSSLKKITFQGDAPAIYTEAFYQVAATAYYPADNETWTQDVMQDYGGNITWVACGAEEAAAPGDVNGDGKLEPADAALLLQYLAGWSVEIDEQAADVNGDGKLEPADAALLLQYLAGWGVTLGSDGN